MGADHKIPSRLFKRLACAMMGLAFFLLAGGPLALLQVAAWTKMMHDFSRTGSLTEAVSKTLDGRHLCPLCQKIAKARSAEEKAPATVKIEKKSELYVVQSGSSIPLPSCRPVTFGLDPYVSMPERSDAPPVPVPRNLLS